jgi:hypothetical protein
MSLGPIAALPIGVNVQPLTTPLATPTTTAQIASAITAAAAVAEAGDIADLAPNTAVVPTSTLLNTAAIQAATTQDSLAPLLADLTAALQSSALPAAARTAVQQLLAAQTPLTSATTASSLQTAVAGSGLFLEANLAAAAVGNGQTVALDTSGDTKALLLQLSSTLAPTSLAPTSLAPTSLAPTSLDPAATDPLAAALVGSTLQSRPQARLPQRLPPRPVIAGAVTAGQPVAKAGVGPDTSSETLTSSLRQEAAAALARLTMSQLASVPTSGQTTRWTFELPVETPGGLAIAQFEISRDGNQKSGSEAAEPTWRARFSMDVEPSGPVHAEVSLSGGRTRATLWAERADSHQSLDAQQGELTAALAEGEGADAAVRIVAGAPPDTTPQVAGRYVDRTS